MTPSNGAESNAGEGAALPKSLKAIDDWVNGLEDVRREGEVALRRLLPIAQRDTGQSSVVARFLVGLYNGERFPFDLTELRRLDTGIFDDCIAVLKMDSQPLKEVQDYFENGSAVWEALASEWGFKDYSA